MAYNLGTDTYSCDICGFEMQWDVSDLVHGEMWGCEKCGGTFCSKCFIDRYGREEYMRMMQQSDLVCIPHRRVQEHLAHARHCQEYPKGVHSALRADT